MISQTKIPSDAAVALVANPERADAAKVAVLVQETPVTSSSGVQRAVEWIAAIKSQHDEVDAKRKSFTEPLRKVVEEINDFFRPALDALKQAEKEMKKKISAYTVESLEKRDELLAQVEQTKAPEAREELIVKADKLAPPKVAGMSIRETWKGEVVDPEAVVKWAIEKNFLAFLSPDPKAILAYTKKAGRDPGIPGWKAWCDRNVAITTSKVKS